MDYEATFWMVEARATWKQPGCLIAHRSGRVHRIQYFLASLNRTGAQFVLIRIVKGGKIVSPQDETLPFEFYSLVINDNVSL